MRVIAGSAGGIRLVVPETDVRPTMDRVKAAIFSSLGERVIGARVLDLFAGTGGLGIEALSRGAASVLFVEQNAAAVRAIEQNFTRANVTGGRVRKQDVRKFLGNATATSEYDIIFADPPYDTTEDGTQFTPFLLRHRNLPQLLSPDGVFVLEKRPEEELVVPAAWQLVRARTYGATEVLFLSAIGKPKSAID